jgi:hypothetical protein
MTPTKPNNELAAPLHHCEWTPCQKQAVWVVDGKYRIHYYCEEHRQEISEWEASRNILPVGNWTKIEHP